MFRLVAGAIIVAALCAGCADNKAYQEYIDFEDRQWLLSDTARFEFTIEDTTSVYNLFCNVRNSTDFPYARVFVNFTMADTSGMPLHKALLTEFLFDAKSGEPFGKSGLGDLYDHQIPVLKNFKFQGKGPYRVSMQQFNRTDTLTGIISVGLAIERTVQP